MSDTSFVGRFEQTRWQLRLAQLGYGVCRTIFVAALGFAMLAVADYWLELPWVFRAIGLGALGVAVLVVAGLCIVGPMRWWSRPQAAAEIERRFPQLGQRVRTTVQFAGREHTAMADQGVTPDLVAALEQDTDNRTRRLDFGAVVPWRRLKTAAVLAGAPIVLLVIAAAVSWQWRLTIERALLAETPYTTLAVSPGDVLVDQGGGLTVSAHLEGRTRRRVVLFSRSAGETEAPWTQRELALSDRIGPRSAEFSVELKDLQRPTEYRVLAGSAESQPYHVTIRYPLAIEKFEVALTPPAYTGAPPRTIEGGDLEALKGTRAEFRIELDRRPAEALLQLNDPVMTGANTDERPVTESVPLSVDGTTLSGALQLTEEKIYSVVARAADGTQLPENRYRIQVIDDESPAVRFEDPSVALEVHSLAEVLMRIRVHDDYGLGRAGIVFQVNNAEEQTLLLRDFPQQTRLEDGEPDGASPATTAVLEEVLPLELFELSQKDSVIYYAFAQDNSPDQPQRTVTDLRFIDIRPFKRIYKAFRGGGGGGGRSITLEELIARQRFALNRTVRLAKRTARADQLDLGTVDRLIDFESALAEATREFAEGFEAIADQRIELFYQAEEAMFASVDSLAAANYDNASLQQKDALRYLVEAREKVLQVLAGATDGRLWAFDRSQYQKLRTPLEELDEARQVVARLLQLAEREDFVYATLSGASLPDEQRGNDPPEADGQAESVSDGPSDAQAEPQSDTDQAANAQPGDDPNGHPEADELLTRQRDIAREASDLERLLQTLDGLSDLARSRMTRATQTAEQASDALARGDTPEAIEAAGQAAALFDELARHVAALLARDAAQRIAHARNMSSDLARLQRDLGGKMADQGAEAGRSSVPPGQSDASGSDDALGRLAEEAERLGESGLTLEDLLQVVARSDEPDAQDAIRRVEELLQQAQLAATVQRMRRLGDVVLAGSVAKGRSESAEIAAALEELAARLDALYQSIVAPRLQQLMALEERAVALQSELDSIDTQMRITEWHRAADLLAQDLATSSSGTDAADDLLDAMQAEGWEASGRNGIGNWSRVDGLYQPPATYQVAVRNVIEHLQDEIRELFLSDMVADGDQATPPEYRELVDRYYEVLSTEIRKD